MSRVSQNYRHPDPVDPAKLFPGHDELRPAAISSPEGTGHMFFAGPGGQRSIVIALSGRPRRPGCGEGSIGKVIAGMAGKLVDAAQCRAMHEVRRQRLARTPPARINGSTWGMK